MHSAPSVAASDHRPDPGRLRRQRAKGCRGFKQSVWVARDLRNRGKLPKLVLINAYGKGGVNDDLIRFALKVFVDAARSYPDRIKLLDWVKHSLPHHKIETAPGAWFLPVSSIRTSRARKPRRPSSPRSCRVACRRSPPS